MQPKVLRQLYIVVELASAAAPSGSAHWADQTEGKVDWGERVGRRGRKDKGGRATFIVSMLCLKNSENQKSLFAALR